jgi:PAS domain S-box-containing protein
VKREALVRDSAPAKDRIESFMNGNTAGPREMEMEELHRSEERFRLLVEGVQDYAIFMLDPEGRIISWNVGAERIKGYKTEEAIGRHFSIFYPPEDIAAGKPARELRIAIAQGRVEDEGWRLRRDGTRFWANVLITALFDGSGVLRGFAKVTRDMTERRRIEALQEADRQKNEFLAVLAHELRNPLAPIRNALYVIGRPDAGPGEIARAQAIAERQVRHMAKLLDDLLDVSRVSQGHIELRRERFDLSTAARQAVDAMRGIAQERGQEIRLELPEEPVPIDADPTRVDQVFINLLSNAVKYTGPGGHIGVSVACDGEGAVVRVRDDGSGIEAEMLPKIFDFFVQAERHRGSSGGGFGIGLTLVRKVLELHGGSISASSAGLGQGAEFAFRLPLAGPAAARGDSDSASLDAFGSGGPLRILVVDDNVDLAESLALMFRFMGHEVRTVFDGPEALRAAEDFHPELVLLDIGMPLMSGYEVARRLRGAPDGGDPFIVALTGWGEQSDRLQSKGAGINEHLVKPVEPQSLERVIEKSRRRAAERGSSRG